MKKLKITPKIILIIFLVCAVLDFLVMSYWIGIYHHYNPDKHIYGSASHSVPTLKTGEYSFGYGAINRYTQLIVASLLCLLTHGACGLFLMLKIKGPIRMLFILAICCRAFWFYVETRQLLISARTVTRREQEITYWINEPLEVIKTDKAIANKEHPPEPEIAFYFFNGICYVFNDNYKKQHEINLEKSMEYRQRKAEELSNKAYQGRSQKLQDESRSGNLGDNRNTKAKNQTEAEQADDKKKQSDNIPKYGIPLPPPLPSREELLQRAEIEKLQLGPGKLPSRCKYEYELPLFDTVFIGVHLILCTVSILAFAMFYGNGGLEFHDHDELDHLPSEYHVQQPSTLHVVSRQTPDQFISSGPGRGSGPIPPPNKVYPTDE